MSGFHSGIMFTLNAIYPAPEALHLPGVSVLLERLGVLLERLEPCSKGMSGFQSGIMFKLNAIYPAPEALHLPGVLIERLEFVIWECKAFSLALCLSTQCSLPCC